ncbi:hypothetical protein MJH12_12730, partial [bacterium]|nr:hypothetical protein [bacterium]
TNSKIAIAERSLLFLHPYFLKKLKDEEFCEKTKFNFDLIGKSLMFSKPNILKAVEKYLDKNKAVKAEIPVDCLKKIYEAIYLNKYLTDLANMKEKGFKLDPPENSYIKDIKRLEDIIELYDKYENCAAADFSNFVKIENIIPGIVSRINCEVNATSYEVNLGYKGLQLISKVTQLDTKENLYQELFIDNNIQEVVRSYIANKVTLSNRCATRTIPKLIEALSLRHLQPTFDTLFSKAASSDNRFSGNNQFSNLFNFILRRVLILEKKNNSRISSDRKASDIFMMCLNRCKGQDLTRNIDSFIALECIVLYLSLLDQSFENIENYIDQIYRDEKTYKKVNEFTNQLQSSNNFIDFVLDIMDQKIMDSHPINQQSTSEEDIEPGLKELPYGSWEENQSGVSQSDSNLD